MADLRELIARVERADGPDLQLDADIWAALGYDVFPAMPGDPQHLYRHRIEGTDYYDDWCVPDLTASIDAAMSLVPEGWHWSVGTWSGNFATVGKSVLGKAQIDVEPCATPALALCLAALKAREADDAD